MNDALHRRQMDVAAAVVPMAGRASRDAASEISQGEMLSKVVHIVDHDWERLRSHARLLRHAGYQPICHDNGTRFVAQADNLAPGCVLLTLQSDRMDDLEVLRRFGGRSSALPVVMVSDEENFETAIQSMKLGAADFILERDGSDGQPIILAVEEALSNLSRELSDVEERLAADALVGALSPRENDILRGLFAGMRNKEIAAHFSLSIRTVEMHRARMMEKLQIARLSEALQIASKANLEPLTL